MMKRNIKWLVLLICILLYQKVSVFAQSSSYVKDSIAYIFLWRGTLENGSPLTTYIVVESTSNLSGLSLIQSRDSFICSFLKTATLFEEPFFTLEKNVKLYDFSNKESTNKFLSSVSGKVDKLNKRMIKIGTKKFEKGTSIDFECVKVIADFWVITDTFNELNNYSHSFKIDTFCYTKKYIYNLKSIDRVQQLSSKEILQLKEYLGL